ncbi:MAG: tetratricopeptide repeat protein [Planctomycetota bacterium]
MPSIAQLEKLLSVDPEDTFVLYGLAQEHAKAGDHAKAVEHYDRCLAVDEAYCYAYFHKARSLEAMGEPEAASETLRAGLLVAQRTGDAKATSEIAGYLSELTA